MTGSLRVLAALALLAACTGGPAAGSRAVDADAYRVAADPQGKEAWQRAQQALRAGDREAALRELRVAVARCPDLVRAHLAYQDVAGELGGDARQQMREYYRTLPDRPSPVPAYVKARLADTSYERGTELQRILAAHRSFAWAHLSLGRLRREQGQLQQASESFQAALAADGELYEARLERAHALSELGRYEEAALDYDAYLARMPDDDAVLRAYVAMLVYRLGRIDAARRILDRLEQKHPGDLTVRMDRAAANMRAGDPRAAVATYLAVLAQKPDDARAALNVGLLYYYELGRDEADRRVFWPKARAAFALFLRHSAAGDGHEAFERGIAVPYRLEVIGKALGPDARTEFTVEDLRLPSGP